MQDEQSRGHGAPGVLRALGCMSGTSLDGVDAAVIETDGERILSFGPGGYREYTETERTVLTAALGRWPGPGLEDAGRVLLEAHLALLSQFGAVDLIGFHGQTLAHEPHGRGTHQLGDGEALSQRLGLPVVWDFRTADVAAGGEGAPLAPFFHHACAVWIGAEEPVVFLNMGGVGNLTWADPRIADPAQPGALLSFDTGPANAPINDLMQDRFGMPYDANGEIAAEGHPDEAVVQAFLSEPYFSRDAPKSLDRNDFGDMLGRVSGMADADAAATLTMISAASVARGMELLPERPGQVLVTGGGRSNPVLMQMLGQSLGCRVRPVEDVGLDGDLLEAQAFGYLAARVMRGLPISAPGTTAVPEPVCGGRLSRPAERRSA